MVIGCFGHQRSGKTALAMLMSRKLHDVFGIEIYTNIDTYGTTNEIEKLTDIPVDSRSKIFLWDEIHFSMDSRNISRNVDFTPFISTLGKQKILLLYTCPTPDLVDKRIRKFTNHYLICKGDKEFIYYQFVDSVRGSISPLYKRQKNEALFRYLDYNSDLVVPNMINANISDYVNLVSPKKERCI